jgi:hypothetical protein
MPTLTSHRRQFWKTSSFGGSAGTSALDLAALRSHLDRCDAQREPFFAARCGLDAIAGFAAPRLITGLILFALVSILATCAGN